MSIFDDFTRGSSPSNLNGSSTSDGNSSWTVDYGNLRTVSPGYLEVTNLDEESGAQLDDNITSSNVRVKVDFDIGSNTGAFNVTARADAAFENFWFGGLFYDSDWFLYLYKVVAGVEVFIDEVSIGGTPPPAGSVLYLECDGNDITLGIEGNPTTVTTTDSDVSNAGGSSFYMYQFNGTKLKFNNYTVEPVGAAVDLAMVTGHAIATGHVMDLTSGAAVDLAMVTGHAIATGHVMDLTNGAAVDLAMVTGHAIATGHVMDLTGVIPSILTITNGGETYKNSYEFETIARS